MKRIWVYIIGVILLLVTAGSVFLAYSVIVTPGSIPEKTETAEPAESEKTAAADPAGTKTVKHLSREESYVESATGIEFPGQIGVFVKTSVRENLNPLFGVSITYQTLDDSPCAGIYVYSLDPESTPVNDGKFAAECELTHNNILNMKRKDPMINSVREIPAGEKYSPSVYAKWYEVTVKDEVIHSHLLMLCHAGKVIKIRVSFPADDTGNLNDVLLFERTVLELFK